MDNTDPVSLLPYQRNSRVIERQLQPEIPPPLAPSEYDTLLGLLRVLRRRWQAVLLVSMAVLVVGTIVCLRITPKYSATTIVELNGDERSDPSSVHSNDFSRSPDQLKAEIQTDVSLLQSDGLALEVIKRLNLATKTPFRNALDSNEKGKSLDDSPLSRERLVTLFRKNLKIESPADTRLISITFENPDAHVAADVSNNLAAIFIEDTLERRHRSTTDASYWLQRELGDLKQQVEKSEQNLADYERNTGLAGIQLTGGTSSDGSSNVSVTPHNTVDERLFALNQELTSAEASRISAETIYNLVRSQNPELVLGLSSLSVSNPGGSATAGLNSDGGIELVRSLRAEEASLNREYAAAAVKYGTNNPRLIQVQQRLDAIKEQIQTEMRRISARAQNAYVYARENENKIRSQFVKQQSAANVMADATVQLHVLAQEAYSNRSLYESLFSKLQTESLAAGVRATRIDVVEKALPPGSPSSPEYLKYFAAIFGISLFCGVSSAFVRESLDETVRTSGDLATDAYTLPVLGYVPRLNTALSQNALSGANELITSPFSPFSESFRSLRTSVMVALRPAPGRTVLVTSAVGGAGKTLTAYNLAVAIAQQGLRVLLIDADLRHPELHNLFGSPRSPGLGDIADQTLTAPTGGITQHEILSSLYLLPAGKQVGLPAEFFSSQIFDKLLENVEGRFDFVIIDSPPVLPVTDASIIATKVDGIIGVLRSQSTTRPAFSGLLGALQRTGSPILGFVLNDVRHPTLDGFHEYSYLR